MIEMGCLCSAKALGRVVKKRSGTVASLRNRLRPMCSGGCMMCCEERDRHCGENVFDSGCVFSVEAVEKLSPYIQASD